MLSIVILGLLPVEKKKRASDSIKDCGKMKKSVL